MFEVRTCLSVWCFEPINRFGHLQGADEKMRIIIQTNIVMETIAIEIDD